MFDYTLQSKLMTASKRFVIWEEENFFVSTTLIPHNCKFDGGHITIRLKNPVQNISDLDDKRLFTLAKLIQKCEKALLKVLNDQGIETPFTNNMDMGNWAVFGNKPKSLHVHIYGRAKNSKKQTFGQALYLPDPHTTFYDNNQPLTSEDIAKIKELLEHV